MKEWKIGFDEEPTPFVIEKMGNILPGDIYVSGDKVIMFITYDRFVAGTMDSIAGDQSYKVTKL